MHATSTQSIQEPTPASPPTAPTSSALATPTRPPAPPSPALSDPTAPSYSSSAALLTGKYEVMVDCRCGLIPLQAPLLLSRSMTKIYVSNSRFITLLPCYSCWQTMSRAAALAPMPLLMQVKLLVLAGFGTGKSLCMLLEVYYYHHSPEHRTGPSYAS